MQGENEKKKKKKKRGTKTRTTLFSSIKHVRKFHVLVVQNNGKEMYKKKYAATSKLLFVN